MTVLSELEWGSGHKHNLLPKSIISITFDFFCIVLRSESLAVADSSLSRWLQAGY